MEMFDICNDNMEWRQGEMICTNWLLFFMENHALNLDLIVSNLQRGYSEVYSPGGLHAVFFSFCYWR